MKYPAAEILIAYEMNGEPLDADHGAPFRLIVPHWSPPWGRDAGSVDGWCFAVRIAVEFARADDAGVGGAGRGHHGVRKGTHASFVGDAAGRLEGFAEKHTKG